MSSLVSSVRFFFTNFQLVDSSLFIMAQSQMHDLPDRRQNNKTKIVMMMVMY